MGSIYFSEINSGSKQIPKTGKVSDEKVEWECYWRSLYASPFCYDADCLHAGSNFGLHCSHCTTGLGYDPLVAVRVSFN